MILMEKGQASIEFLVLVAFFLVFLVPIVTLMFNLSGDKSDELSVQQAQQLGRRMVDAADGIYIQGGGAAKVEYLFFPSRLSDIGVGTQAGHELFLTVETANGPTDIVFMSIAPLRTGTGDKDLSQHLGSGLKPVRIYNDGDEVVIEYAG